MTRSEDGRAPRGAAARGQRGSAAGSRRRSRELALQALYEWLVAGHDADALLRSAAENPEHGRADTAHLGAIVHGVIDAAADLNGGIQPFLDRPAQSLSPVEHALL